MIDFHCHLDLFPDPRAVAAECRALGIETLSVTTTPSAWRGTTALAVGAPRIRTALGLHPQLAFERRSELRLFDQFLPETMFVGEIGLDGSPKYQAPWTHQVEVFQHILCACEDAGGRILSVHSRRAATPVLDALAAAPGTGTAILHWFSGTQSEVTRAASDGHWFSINAAMLAHARGRQLITRMPPDRVLTETDGPFTLTQGRSTRPRDVAATVVGLAEVWHVTVADVAQRLSTNLARLLSTTAGVIGDVRTQTT